ncbi:hypothetical protein E6O75_ATG03345 [Venturia nashicola]|uniref:Uncharacterized protein n=1 Tax=Venturia nashicola TaxID=86259 RepID=A0A4Z1P9T7_9PEZI|nr:hypothetical protein E6O75_ATG03345 [Venturia nashicola]
MKQQGKDEQDSRAAGREQMSPTLDHIRNPYSYVRLRRHNLVDCIGVAIDPLPKTVLDRIGSDMPHFSTRLRFQGSYFQAYRFLGSQEIVRDDPQFHRCEQALERMLIMASP